MQGIYRVNGVKTRVEKLCQAFENGKELVELSQSSPHDISNVLKLYLRQVSLSYVDVSILLPAVLHTYIHFQIPHTKRVSSGLSIQNLN